MGSFGGCCACRAPSALGAAGARATHAMVSNEATWCPLRRLATFSPERERSECCKAARLGPTALVLQGLVLLNLAFPAIQCHSCMQHSRFLAINVNAHLPQELHGVK